MRCAGASVRETVPGALNLIHLGGRNEMKLLRHLREAVQRHSEAPPLEETSGRF